MRTGAGVLLRGAWRGLAIGCLTGLFEVMVLSPAPAGSKLALLLPAVLLYGMVWAMVGVVVGAARVAACRAFRRPVTSGEASTRWDLAVLIPSAIFVVGGGYINMRYLPGFLDPFSVLFDVVFLLANVGLGYWLYRHGVSWARRLISRVWKVGLGMVAVALMLAVLTGSRSLWERTKAVQAPRASAPASAPNVLLIVIDALRPDHLSLYGYERKTSPHLEEFAQEGVVFSEAFANSPWTKPSTATMFTSLYPSTHNVNLWASALSPELVTLPEVLQAHGYATGLFAANTLVSPQFGFAQGVDRFYYNDVPRFDRLILGHVVSRLRRRSGRLVSPDESGIHIPRVSGPALNRALIDWLRTLKGGPFFAYLHYMEPHDPYGAPAPYTVQFDVVDPDAPAIPQMRPPSSPFGALQPFTQDEPLAPRQVRHLIARYDGEIAYVDQVVGELFEALRELGLYDRTLIIVTADHGEEFYEHGGWSHGHSLFNEVLRVPLIMRYLPAWPTGTVVAQTARHVDLMPTVLDLCGIPTVNGLEGRSLVPLLRAPEASRDSRPVYSEVFHGGSYARAVQDGGFKLIESHAGPRTLWLLFDLAEDPEERRPLDADAHPRGPQLKQLLASFRERSLQGAVAPQMVQVDLDTKEELRALGYLQ